MKRLHYVQHILRHAHLRGVETITVARLLVWLLVLLATQPAFATVLGKSGSQFTIDGTPTYLLGIAYYDCSNWHASDVDYVMAKGFRLFACHLDDIVRNNPNSLYNTDGTLREAKVTAFQAFISYVDSKGGVVDLNVTYADTDGKNSAAWLTSPTINTAITNAITNAVNQFKANSNVFFSVVNEHDYGSYSDSHGEVNGFLTTARNACPSCILTYSSSDNFGPVAGRTGHIFTTRTDSTPSGTDIDAELAGGIDILMPHNSWDNGWGTLGLPRGSNLRAYLNANGGQNIPILFEEDGHEPASGALGSADAYLQYHKDVKASGVAGSVFMTIAGFDLSSQTFLQRLGAIDQTVVDTLSAYLAANSGPRIPTNLRIVQGGGQ